MNVGPITRRILKWHDKATLEQLESGTGWYLEARYFAGDLAHSTPYSVEQVAALIAVLSPQVSWENNQQAAVKAVDLHLAGDWDGESLPGYSGYRINARKAKRILDGDIDALVGPKVTAFYNAIRGDLTDVVIDIWAIRAARPKDINVAKLFRDDEMPNMPERRAVVEAYKRAAALRGVAPSEMQAIVWTVIRDSGVFPKVQSMSEADSKKFYVRQTRMRQKLDMTIYTYDSYWQGTPRGREVAMAATA